MNYEYKLSICMMVKDEEVNIERCLDSIKPLVDSGIAEIIVIDTGSKDGTPKIVKQYTDKLYFHPWNDNFSDMRNISISYAKGEWIFIIDADERLDNPEKFVELFLNSDLKTYNTILLYVKNLYSKNDENNFNQNISPRIFKNDGSFYYQGSVHNQPMMKEPQLSFDISLTHYGYISNDKELMEKKYIRTVALLKKELQLDPNNIYYLYQLGVSYDMHNEHKEALEEFRKAYKLLSKEKNGIRKNYINVYGSYIRAAYTNQEYEEVKKIGIEALALNKEYIDIYYILSLTAKQLHNQNDLLQNCLEYDRFYKIFNTLNISKDYSVIMYHIDDHSRDFIYTELSLYYIKDNQLNTAYEYAKEVINKTQNIYLMIKIFVKKYDFNSLKKYYINQLSDNQRDSFFSTLEKELKGISNEKRVELYKEFCDIEDSYGALCEFRLYSSSTNIQEYLKYFDFGILPLFYSEVLLNLKQQLKTIISIFKPLSILKIRTITKYLIDEDPGFIDCFEEYLQAESIRANDLQSNKTYVAVAAVMLMYNSNNNIVINNSYQIFFQLYVDRGINYVSQLYQIQKSRLIYNDISNDEDKFFVLMSITRDNLQKGNFKLAVKYLHEALKSNNFMSKYIELYKNEIFNNYI